MTSKRYLFWDLETHNAGSEYSMTPREFFRLGQYAWNDGPVTLTEDYDEMIRVIREADYVVGHNIISFDLPVLFGRDSLEPLYMAMERKVIDTFYLAQLLTPAPYSYTDRTGHTYFDAASPIQAKKWLSLDNLCFQFGIEGKFGSLKEMAKKYNPAKTRVADLDYSLIPTDDEDFRMYAEQDVIAVRGLFDYLLARMKQVEYPGDYVWREMELMSATAGQMTSNGILVNKEYAEERINEQAKRREEVLALLRDKYGFPTEGKSPWASDAGKEATLRALADFGITPESRPDWPRNKPTAKNPEGSLKLGGEDLKLVAAGAGPEAEEFVDALAEMKGQRTLAQLVMDNMKPDGRVHPDVTSLQRSGRWSFTKPGVTIFGERTEALKKDKALFIAGEGKVMAGFDYSSADARAMAALSGDEEFARRFETDEDGNDLHDGHNLTGEAMFGKEIYWSRVDKNGKPTLRPVAKVGGHAQNYNIGAYKLAVTLNEASRKEGLGLTFWAPNGRGAKALPHPEDAIETPEMVANFNATYVWLKRFKDWAVREAEENGYVTNSWGRRMTVDEGREFTQAPALHGQSATREMMGDAILRLIRRGEYYIRALRAIIHDELLLELDEDRVEEDIKVIRECMEADFDPKTNVSIPIRFPVGYGYGKTWKDAGH